MAYKLKTRADIRLYRKRRCNVTGSPFILSDCTEGAMYCLTCGTDKNTVTQAWIDRHELYIEVACEYDDPDLRCSGCSKQLAGYLDDTQRDGAEVLLDSARGVYIPQTFADSYPDAEGWTPDLRETLRAGPDNEHYWDAWTDVLDCVTLVHPQTSARFRLHHDGDLWAIPVDDPRD